VPVVGLYSADAGSIGSVQARYWHVYRVHKPQCTALAVHYSYFVVVVMIHVQFYIFVQSLCSKMNVVVFGTQINIIPTGTLALNSEESTSCLWMV